MPGTRKLRRGRPLDNWKAAFNDIMKRKSARIPAATTRQSVQQRVNNGDCKVLSPYTVSLRCPLSKKRIVVATRGVNCTHLQCFDLATFLEGPARSGLWYCPLCSKDTKLDGLRIDELFNEVLKSFAADANVETVELLSDGAYRAVHTEGAAPDALINDDEYELEPVDVKPEIPTVRPEPAGSDMISPSAPCEPSGVAVDVVQSVSVETISPSRLNSTWATSDLFTKNTCPYAPAAEATETALTHSSLGKDTLSPGDSGGLKAYETQPATVPMPTDEEVATLSKVIAQPCSPCAVESMGVTQRHCATEATLFDKEVQTPCVANATGADVVQALRTELQRVYRKLSAETTARHDLNVKLTNTIEERLKEKERLRDTEHANRMLEARIQVLMQQLDALKKATVVERLVIASVATCAQQSQASVAHAQHQQQEYVQQLHARIHTQQLEGETYMKQLHETAKENLVLKGKLKNVEETAAYFEKRLNDQRLEIEDLKVKNSAQAEKYASEVNVLEGKLKTLTEYFKKRLNNQWLESDSLKKAEGKLKNAEETAADFEKRLNDQRLENEDFKAKNCAQALKYASEIYVLEGKLKKVEETAAHFEKRLNDLLRENDALKAKNSAQSQKYAAEVARLKKKVEDLKDADFDSRSKIRRLRLELDEKEKDLKRLSTNSNWAARHLSSAFVATGECLKRRRNVIKIGPIQKRTSHSVDQTEHVGLADMLIPISPPPVAPPVYASTLDGGCENPICIEP